MTSRYALYGLLAVLGAPWMIALAVMLAVRALTAQGRAISMTGSILVLRFPFRVKTLDASDIVLVSSSKFKADAAASIRIPNPLKIPTRIELPQVRIDLRDGKQVFFRSGLLRERAHEIACSLSQALHTEFGEDI
jgi:hypothetical protein